MLFERVKKLADDHGESLKSVALKLGLGENSMYGWKTKSPSIDKVQKVADYFDVSTDYLLGRTDDTGREKTADIDDKQVIMTYQGKPIPEEDMELIKRLLRGKE